MDMDNNKDKYDIDRYYIDDVIFASPINKNRELRIIKRYQELPCGETKKNMASYIVRANSLFLAKAARDHGKKRGMNTQDLFSQGKLAMYEALDKFDPTRGNKFISFAVWYVRKAFSEVLHEKDLISHNQTKQTRAKLKTPAFLAVNPMKYTYSSLDSPLSGENDDMTLGDMIPSKNPLPDTCLDHNCTCTVINEALAHVGTRNKRWEKVLVMYYGLRGGKPYTLREVGENLELSVERSRQLLTRAKGAMMQYIQRHYEDFIKNKEYMK